MLRKIWKNKHETDELPTQPLARTGLTILYLALLPLGLGARFFSDRLAIKTIPTPLWQARTTEVDTLETLRRQT